MPDQGLPDARHLQHGDTYGELVLSVFAQKDEAAEHKVFVVLGVENPRFICVNKNVHSPPYKERAARAGRLESPRRPTTEHAA